MEPESMLLNTITQISMLIIVVSILLVIVRLMIGPDPADRIVAMDLIPFLIVSFIVTFSLYSGIGAFLDVAIAYALISFLGTIALARFRERLARKPGLHKSDKHDTDSHP